mgnify:CR=1 FL=1
MKSRGRLLPSVNRLYEARLALLELRALGARNVAFDLVGHSFLFEADARTNRFIGFRTAWLADVDGVETFVSRLKKTCEKVVWKHSDLWGPHLAYPYKARMRPQVARSLLNIACPKPRGLVLDPFCGSGTTNVEAALLGLDSVGVDIVPWYAFMAHAKMAFFNRPLDDPEHPLRLVVVESARISEKINWRKRLEELKTLQEGIRPLLGEVPPTKHRFLVGTATKLPFPDGHFDAVVTSPPYGPAIDYPEMNPGPPELMRLPEGLEGEFMATDDIPKWKKLMGEAISEMVRVLKAGGRLAMVLGNVKKGGRIVDLVGWAKEETAGHGMRLLLDVEQALIAGNIFHILFDRVLVWEKM